MIREDLPTTVEVLQKLLLQSRSELTQSRGELTQLQSKASLAQLEVKELSATVTEQRQEIEKQQLTITELLSALRGKSRERIDPDQLLMFELGELETLIEEQEEKEPPARRRRRKHGRRLIPDNLPQEEVVHELPEHKRLCPHDDQPMQLIRFEESKQLEYEPAKIKVIVHKRAVYACSTQHDEAKLITAPKPPQPIDKGLPGPGLIAALTVGKFGDHIPGYRWEDILARHGVQIRRSTIYDWLSAAAVLVEPLVELMKERVLQSKVIQTDDTQVKLIDKQVHGTQLARFWAYIGDRGHPYIVYDFTETREGVGPREFLKGYQGYLQADAYSGYDSLFRQSSETIVEVACWTHCRRYWWKAREHDPPRAHHVIAVIRQLYDIERATKDMSSEQRRAKRVEHATPLLTELKQWLDTQDVLPKSDIGKAFTYTRNQWMALNRYLEDGDLSIDNNASERCMKPVAIGRKAWLFVGSETAGKRAANLMTLINTCKECRVEPWAYLRDVLKELPKGIDLETLLPDNWLKANPEHRWAIADQRAEERVAKGNL